MALIRKDEIGLWAAVGGYMVRPTDGYSTFKEGDKPKAIHFGGTTSCGIGKLEGIGNYKETWMTSGDAYPIPSLNLRCYSFINGIKRNIFSGYHQRKSVREYADNFEIKFSKEISAGKLEQEEIFNKEFGRK